MSDAHLWLYLFATLAGGLISGLTGFAMGVVMASMWLHIISPLQTATLILCFGFITLSHAIWTLRHALSWKTLAPYIYGGMVGAPLGVMLLTHINPDVVRLCVGLLLVTYALLNLLKPKLATLQSGFAVDFVVGMVNGLVGGLTGLTGIIIAIWCQMRGWPKDTQRMVFQPVNLMAIVFAAGSLAVTGSIAFETIQLFLYGLPLVVLGQWIGLKYYGKLNDAAFRKLLLWLFLLTGVALVLPSLGLFK